MNPKWRDLISAWEDKYGLEFRLDGRIVAKQGWERGQNEHQTLQQNQTQDPSTPVSHAGESAREPSSAQDD